MRAQQLLQQVSRGLVEGPLVNGESNSAHEKEIFELREEVLLLKGQLDQAKHSLLAYITQLQSCEQALFASVGGPTEDQQRESEKINML